MSDKKHESSEIEKKLLAALKTATQALTEQKSAKHEPIAVVGMSCRFPGGANSLDEYWSLLAEGRDAIVTVPKDRWNLDEYYDPDPDVTDKMYCKWGGFLDLKISEFDAKFFDINLLEAQMMDPQQRLALEVTWEALENANINIKNLRGSNTGVFFGISTSDYLQIIEANADYTAYTNTGIAHSVLAGRVSYELGLQGPSIVLDTACSSSLVAIHEAVRSLRENEIDLAAVGAVNLMLTPNITIGFCKGRFLAADGRCKTFDDAANGYVRGEGCGVIILKRLSDAQRDKDNILAVIKGTAVNQDGASGGLTVPNGPAQEAVIKKALLDASVKPNQVNYVEAHGTGTPLGDPIEIHALENVLKEGRSLEEELLVASVKTNIGHLEPAAGMASVIKVILALQNQLIPKHLHFHKLNHNINLDEGINLQIPVENKAWLKGNQPRIAGVSGFAFQGTNAHIVIEEAPEATQKNVDVQQGHLAQPSHILAISAKSNSALNALASKFELLLNNQTSSEYLAKLCFTANTCRTHFNHRLALVSKDIEQAKKQLQNWLTSGECLGVISAEVLLKATPKIVLLFTGQGSQYAGMGKVLYQMQPEFKKIIDKCAEILAKNKYLDKPLLELLWGSEVEYLDETKYTQPALFALEYALYELWQSLGIKPQAVMGHSIGEYVAACVAGVFSLDDGLKLIAKRAALMQGLPRNGSMAAIAVGEDEIGKVLSEYANQVSIAAVNGPNNVVISGHSDKVKEITERYAAQKIKTNILQVSHAFHSILLEPMLDEFAKVLNEVKFTEPTITLISNVSGDVITKGTITNSKYWLKHTREAVNFSKGVKSLLKLGFINFLEIGPHPVLTAMAQESVEDLEQSYQWLPSLRREQDDWQEILTTIAFLYVRGFDINWQSFYKDYKYSTVQLPTYPFQRERYWVEGGFANRSYATQAAQEALRPLLMHRIDSAKDSTILFETEIEPKKTSVLGEHRVYSIPVLPAVAYLEMAMEAARSNVGNNGYLQLEDVGFEKALAVLDGDQAKLQINMTNANNGYDFVIYSRPINVDSNEAVDWSLNVSGVVRILDSSEVGKPKTINVMQIQTRAQKNYPAKEFLELANSGGMSFGPRFSGLEQLWIGEVEALGKVILDKKYSSEIDQYEVYPGILDTGLQLLISNLPFAPKKNMAHLPVGLEKLIRYKAPTPNAWVYVTWQPIDKDDTTEKKALRGDVMLLDENGNTLVEIIGLTAIEAPKQAVLQDVQKQDSSFYYQIVWKEEAVVANDSQAPEKTRFVLFMENSGLAEALCSHIKSIPANDLIIVRHGDAYKNINSHTYEINITRADDYVKLIDELFAAQYNLLNTKLVHMCSLDVKDIKNDLDGDASQKLITSNQQLSYGSVLLLCQTMLQKSRALQLEVLAELIIVTSNTQNITADSENASLWQSGVWGLGKVIGLEARSFKYKLIDTTYAANNQYSQLQNLYNEIINSDPETQIVLTNEGKRLVARLNRADIEPLQPTDKTFKQDASYWITGGLGGLGFTITNWMLEQGAKHIVLIARKPPSQEMQQQIDALNKKYAACVTTLQLDIADSKSLAEAYNTLAKNKPPLMGVIHAAGTLEDALLLQQTWDSYEHVMRPKVIGAWNLHKLSENLALDFLIFFSSQTSMLGNIGQANYAAANAFLDLFAYFLRARDINALSINWGPWAQVGMAANMANASQEQLELNGVRPIAPDKGIQILDDIFSKFPNKAQVAVLDINWSRFILQLGDEVPPLLRELARTHKRATRQISSSESNALLKVLRDADIANRHEILAKYFDDEIKRLLKIPPETTIDRSGPLAALGVDSLLAVEFRNKITKSLGAGLHKAIPATLIFNYPNINALTDFLLIEMGLVQDVKEVTVNEKLQNLDQLIVVPVSRPQAKIRLFCFPYMGGSIETYYPWASIIDPNIEIVCVAPISNMTLNKDNKENFKQLINKLAEAIAERLDDKPFVFFGHSFGTAVAYEVAKVFKERNLKIPLVLILSSFFSPDKFSDFNNVIKDQGSANFMQGFIDNVGVPQQLLQDKKWVADYEQRVFADASSFASYHFDNVILDCPLVVLHCDDDKIISKDAVTGWSTFTSVSCKFENLSGGHFEVFNPETRVYVIKLIESAVNPGLQQN